MRTNCRHRTICRGRAALLWALALFVAGQASLGMWLHRRHPEICDPNWEFRIARLKARLAEAPGRPLVLVLGSSRPANDFSPADLGDWRPHSRPAPVVFNIATLGAGPIRQLLTLRRVLAEGIRPDWVLAEAWPAFWKQEGPYREESAIMLSDMHLSDLPVLSHLYRYGWEGFTRVCTQALPMIHNRTGVLYEYAPLLVPRSTESDVVMGRLHWGTLDDWGWLPTRMEQIPAKHWEQELKRARDVTQPTLEKLEVLPSVRWAIRQLLQECRRRNIKVAFLVFPEHSALRGWYTPHTHAVFTGYLFELQKEYGTPLIDARDWVPDNEFVDFSHLQDAGARRFSNRFGPEVLRPLLEGRPLPASVLLRAGGPEPSGSSTPEPTALPPGP